MSVSVYISGYNQQGEPVSGWSRTKQLPWYETAELDGVEVPVTKGITSTDNHILVEANEGQLDSVKNIEVSFKVPTTEPYTVYRQSFLVLLPK